MSHDFLHSSPSRQLDGAMYNNFEVEESSKKDPKSHSKTNPNQLQLSGWTPLISKTFFNDQFLSYNSTPSSSSKLFNGVYPNQPANNTNNNGEIDYLIGLNLTPFLTHNTNNNLLINSNSNLNLNLNLNSSITPFHDKSVHLTDFFMDSPIRQSTTPLKDLETITPSKFRLNSDRKSRPSIFQDLNKSASKRSITQIDTPPRQPHKLSIASKAPVIDSNSTDEEEEDDEDEEDQDENKQKESKRKEEKKPMAKSKGKPTFNLETPSKKQVLKDVSANVLNTKTPIKVTPLKKVLGQAKLAANKENLDFQTPIKSIPISSPSTVIMSSATTSPRSAIKDNSRRLIPPSPTPKKDSASNCKKDDIIPTMGVFQEKKSKGKPQAFSMVANKNPGGHARFGPNLVSNKKSNKAQMQAGMNKFQIVFTDVHTLMNNKNKNSKKYSHLNGAGRLKKADSSKTLLSLAEPAQASALTSGMPIIKTTNANSQHEFNSTINTSKEFSSIMSGNNSLGNNSSINTSSSNLNLSTSHDQSSFELGGISSTPNGKFFLDKMFDKPSPNHSQNFYSLANTNAAHFSNMPPPHKNQIHHQISGQAQNLHPSSAMMNQQQQLQLQQPMMMMMMMSTPQHQNIINYNPSLYANSNNELSPSHLNDASNANFYQSLYHLSNNKDGINSPSNIPGFDNH